MNQQTGNDLVQTLGPYVSFPQLLERVNTDMPQPTHYVYPFLGIRKRRKNGDNPYIIFFLRWPRENTSTY